MKAKKILNDDIADILISSLPTKPTTPSFYGGKGLSAKEMKEAFDKLPLYIIERFNELLDDINADGDDSLCASIKTGITDSHTLKNLFDDITSGVLSSYMGAPSGTLSEYLLSLREDVDAIKERLGL